MEHFARFKSADWFSEKKKPVLVGGAGGIGSWLSLFLARANFEVFLYDFDSIESHNLGGQFFKHSDVNKKKVQAVSNNIIEFCNDYINFSASKIDKNTNALPYTFAAFDNMEARKLLFDSWLREMEESKRSDGIFIDGRLEAEQLQIFCVEFSKKKNIENYQKYHLFSDSEIDAPLCTLKQTTHVAAMISSLMVSFFTNHISNVSFGAEYREVPFFHEYFVPLNNIVNDVD